MFFKDHKLHSRRVQFIPNWNKLVYYLLSVCTRYVIYFCLFIPNCVRNHVITYTNSINIPRSHCTTFTLSLTIQNLFSTGSRNLKCICGRQANFIIVYWLFVQVHIPTRQNDGGISLQKQTLNGKRQCNATKAGIFMLSNSE